MKHTSILVIDDDAGVHNIVDFELEGVCDAILHAVLPGQGITMAIEQAPDVILLDVMMPAMDGFEVCRALKEDEKTRDIPILFLTADCATPHIARGMDYGGTDYITKPFQRLELQARVRAALRTKRLIDQLKETSTTDGLTGLQNRRAFDAALTAAVSRYRRTSFPLALLMLDIDHFKNINDTYGHAIGDEVLRQVGATINAHRRPYDTTARFGGEEFAVLMVEVAAHEAATIGDRMLDAIRTARICVHDRLISVTASAGLCHIQTHEVSIEASPLIAAADTALYAAKDHGRNQLVIGTYNICMGAAS